MITFEHAGVYMLHTCVIAFSGDIIVIIYCTEYIIITKFEGGGKRSIELVGRRN